MKDNYLVTLAGEHSWLEFNFQNTNQLKEFVHMSILHGVNITVTIEHFPIAEEGEGLKNGIKTNVCDDDNRQRRLP